MLLEVLAGLRSSSDAAQTLGVTPVRYYAIEQRAISGLIAACEPRPSGIQPAAREAQELTRLRDQVARQGQELNQVRSVLRTTQRQLGVGPSAEPPGRPGGRPGRPGKPGTTGTAAAGKKPTKHKVKRPRVRALTMIRRLLQADATATTAMRDAASTAPPPSASSTAEPGGG